MPQSPTVFRGRLALTALLAVGSVLWQHWMVFAGHGSSTDHLLLGLIDLAALLPVAGAAVAVAHVSARLIAPAPHWEPALGAVLAALAMTALYVPFAAVQTLAHHVVGGGHHGTVDPLAAGVGGLLSDAIGQAAQVAPVVLALALVGVLVTDLVRSDLRRLTAAVGHRPARLALAPLLVSTLVAVPTAVGGASPAAADAGGGCATAPRRVFDVYAINVDIVVDRFGDHDPYGAMYVMAELEDEVRAQEAALLAASAADKDDPNAAKVSVGLGQDPIQPLVLRARLGECVVVNLTNKLSTAPRGGPLGNPPITQPGGVPSVSVDMAGVAYDASRGDGGQAVGRNPVNMAAPGETKQYRYYLDPTMGEGARVFRSGGESTQLTAHGLFGTLVAEAPGARWYDPVTGQERTSDTTWNSWEAMVEPVSGPAFREFTIVYHEIGDDNFNLRRPLRENDEGIPIGGDPGVPVGDQVRYGRPLPMIDVRPPTPEIPNEGGGGSGAYRPGSRAINYRSEPFYRRLQLEAERGRETQEANKSLAYSSYTYGDPATPMPRSYLGEPTKTRLVHAGIGQLHVHHVHGGGTRWRLNPGADDTALDAGLQKTPIQDAKSIRLDSQTVSPTETFNLEHECGAGGCQQAAGDFLYHCHIAQHYITGMWGLWRVFDTAQPDLAPLPGRAAPPAAVDSAGLIGKTVEGRTVVPPGLVTDPATQIGVDDLVQSHLPPQGARWTDDSGVDLDDATVWDWLRTGDDDAPVYRGEPETSAVWANYRSPDPGSRPVIMFNPKTGRPAYPMLKPHLGSRPPFAPNGHAGAPGVGATATEQQPGGMCPQGAKVRDFKVTAISVAIQQTSRERDQNGSIFVLNEDKDDVLAGRKTVEPLVIRSNVGDCVDITFGSELDPAQQTKVNMHTHLVQFDPLASDGVVAGFAYEQSVFATAKEDRSLTSVDAPDTITVSTVGKLRPGVSIGVGVGRVNVEVRTIKAIRGNQLVFDSPLAGEHTPGEPVTVEFVRYRYFSDVDSGTVFWHDHVDALTSWSHGLFAAHIIEPKGSIYLDPVTGEEIRSGAIADVVNTEGGSVGVGQSGSFREFTVFMHNGRRGRGELRTPPPDGLLLFNPGQECEEGSINLRAEPLGERTPPGATPADPATTDQRQEYNGARCRNAFSRAPDIPGDPDANTARATVSTVDPYVFSSVKYGDPRTPLLRAYAGDPVVFRVIGVSERAEALRVQGHRFRVERFNGDARLVDTAAVGISERYDYVLDGGAGGPTASPGDYLYHSTRTFALESGAWGIFRVHDRLRDDLRPLPGRVPRSGKGFPTQVAATGNVQADPGPNPAPARTEDGSVDRSVVTSAADPCPARSRVTSYDVSLFDMTLPTAPFQDTGGVVYALTSDVAGIRAGTQPVTPLVLRANEGDCVRITLHNEVAPGSLYGGTRAGFDLGLLARNPQLSGGAAVGLNPDTTVAAGDSTTYTFYADAELGTTLFQNLGSTASLRHGAYGTLVVEPRGSTWWDSATHRRLGPERTSTQAIIRPPGRRAFREFVMTMQTTDQHFNRSILPYGDQVAGNGLNSPTVANQQVPPVPGAPPGTANNRGSFDKGFSHLNYHSDPLTERLGLTAYRDDYTKADVVGSFGTAFSSTPYGEPDTPVFTARSGDPVVFRVGVGASDQFHSFTVSGHMFPIEPRMRGSHMAAAHTIGAGQTIDAWLGPAGGRTGGTGDYLFQDARQSFAVAGIWGVFRVLPRWSRGPAWL